MSVESTNSLSRRQFLALAGLGAAMRAVPARGQTATRIVSLDYGLSSTLLSLGVVPIAIADLAGWDRWMVKPAMPAGVIDVGSSWEVNFEILASLKPDLILTTPYLDQLKPSLEKMAPVLRLEVFSPDGGDILPKALSTTRQLAHAINREREGEAFLQKAEQFFDLCQARIARLSAPPVALVTFMDARHARIYGGPGLFQNVLDRIGVENAWTGQANYWGYETIGIEDLSKITSRDAYLIAFEPVPGDVLPKLGQSPLWHALPFSRPGRFTVMPTVLMFGMVNEAMRFAGMLTGHLEKVA